MENVTWRMGSEGGEVWVEFTVLLGSLCSLVIISVGV